MREDRWRRAHQRRRTEEIMGWICVPVILVVAWFGWKAYEEANPGRPSGTDAVIPSTTSIRRN
jgi:hypothetical protein